MFLVIDGSALAYASFFASSPKEVMRAKNEEEREQYYGLLKRSPDGRYVGSTELFISYVLDFLSDRAHPVNQIAICFDESREQTFRRQMYQAYKAQRQSKPAPLSEELPLIKELLRDVGIRAYENPVYEADDIAGSIARKFERETDIALFTKDRDYLQLVNDKIHVWMMLTKADVESLTADYGDALQIRDNVYDYREEVVVGEIGCTPRQITAWKAISGDASDNIPGVKGVGDKTIIPLLKEYGTLLAIYKEIQDAIRAGKDELLLRWWQYKYGIRPSSVNKLWEGRYDASLFQRLTTIKTDIPVTATLEDYSVSKINMRSLLERLQELGLYELSESLRARFRVI